MWGYDKLYDWKAWIVVIVLILLIIIVLSYFFSSDKKKKTSRSSRRRKERRRRREIAESDSSSDEEPVPARSVKDRRMVPEPAKYHLSGIKSSHDAVPPIPEDPDIPDDYDATPQLPKHIEQSKVEFSGSKGEIASRMAMEKIYGVPFPKDRPSWLVNPKTGQRLELDGVNHDLKLAFEYHGRQHYTYVPYFHKSKQDYIRQVERDNIKLDICDAKGYYIITIPYTVPIDRIEEYIRYYDPETKARREARKKEIKRM